MNPILFNFAKNVLNRFGLHVAKYPYSHQHAFVEDINQHLIARSTGVIHLGAHIGQESELYDSHKIPVLWVEGNPEIFPILQENLRMYPRQRSILALLGDTDGVEVAFKVSDNGAVSSSVFPLDSENTQERFQLDREINLVFCRLDTLLKVNSIDSTMYSHWVIDLQGAELIALRGAGELLKSCSSMFVEVSTRRIYDGGADWIELRNYLEAHGLFPLWTPRNNHHENVIFIRI